MGMKTSASAPDLTGFTSPVRGKRFAASPTPGFKFGSGPARAKLVANGSNAVGPGTYDLLERAGSMGNQALSRKATSPTTKFGKSRRPGLGRKEGFDNITGPGKYKITGTFGKQKQSSFKSAASFSFGKSRPRAKRGGDGSYPGTF